MFDLSVLSLSKSSLGGRPPSSSPAGDMMPSREPSSRDEVLFSPALNKKNRVLAFPFHLFIPFVEYLLYSSRMVT